MVGRKFEVPTAVSLALFLAHFARRCVGLYDPVSHIESARLYGNIDFYAYYYVDLLIGEPHQRVSVIVDTGSGVTAFPCRSCAHCGKHIDPNFDFTKSSTASWIPCGFRCSGSCKNGHCGYSQSYTEGSSISGWFFKDKVHLGDQHQRNPRVEATMGCHQDETKLFYTQKANGIMGLRPPGRGSATMLDQLFGDKPHVNTKVFAMCFAEWGGRLVVGGYNNSYHTGDVSYVPLTTGSGYYHVPLSKMVVNGTTLHTSYGRAMIDSGTTYTYMATGPYKALRSAVEEHCKRNQGCDAKQSGTCYEAPNGLGKFPVVEVWFQKVKTLWTAAAYMYKKGTSGHKYCYGFEDDGPRANTVLGASWMMHQEIIFDLVQSKVGIAPARCPEYKDRPAHNERASLAPPTEEEVRASAAASQSVPQEAPSPAPAAAKAQAPAPGQAAAPPAGGEAQAVPGSPVASGVDEPANRMSESAPVPDYAALEPPGPQSGISGQYGAAAALVSITGVVIVICLAAGCCSRAKAGCAKVAVEPNKRTAAAPAAAEVIGSCRDTAVEPTTRSQQRDEEALEDDPLCGS